MLGCVVKPVFADNGCEDEENDMISAEFALCSTHAYNIGEMENPDAAGRELMRTIIAMKTEVITQQMYRHYQQMESMLKRFQTQLEKAVLSANLKAAGAKSEIEEESNSTFKSTNRNLFVEDVSDCASILDNAEKIECLHENYGIINDAVDGGSKTPTSALKKQLAHDFSVLISMKKGVSETKTSNQTPEVTDCTKDNKMTNKKAFISCLNQHNTNISAVYNTLQEEERNSRRYQLPQQ